MQPKLYSDDTCERILSRLLSAKAAWFGLGTAAANALFTCFRTLFSVVNAKKGLCTITSTLTRVVACVLKRDTFHSFLTLERCFPFVLVFRDCNPIDPLSTAVLCTLRLFAVLAPCCPYALVCNECVAVRHSGCEYFKGSSIRLYRSHQQHRQVCGHHCALGHGFWRTAVLRYRC